MARRPIASVPPPGGSGTMQRMGRAGHAPWARAMLETMAGKAKGAASVAAAPLSRARRDFAVMTFQPCGHCRVE